MKSIDRVCLSENDDGSRGTEGEELLNMGAGAGARSGEAAAQRLEYGGRLISLCSCLTVVSAIGK